MFYCGNYDSLKGDFMVRGIVKQGEGNYITRGYFCEEVQIGERS